jgi:hypothetical protein
MAEPLVTKEYREDLGTKDADGFYDYAYCYWEYTFAFGGRRYRARIYADSPEDACVIYLDGGRPAEYDDDLEKIGECLRQDGIRTISAVGPTGGFEPVISFD